MFIWRMNIDTNTDDEDMCLIDSAKNSYNSQE